VSVDLFVVHGATPIVWQDAQQAFRGLESELDGVAFVAFDEADETTDAYFWNVPRVDVSRTSEEDAAEEGIGELRRPYLVVSSRSGAWPWIQFTAVSLARRLDAGVFDPQAGAFLDELTADYDLHGLRELHEDDLRQRGPRLVTKRWAFCHPVADEAQLLASVVDAMRVTTRELLAIDLRPQLSSGDVNSFQSLELPSGVEIQLSSYTVSGTCRTIDLEAPRGCTELALLADALSARLGVAFRAVDEYR
jgi:hypothetical protein